MEDQVDIEGNGEGYSGTFRWKKSKVLGSMPPRMHPLIRGLFNEDGWMTFFMTRVPVGNDCANLINAVRSDLSFIDCLSSPCTVAYMLEDSLFKRYAFNILLYLYKSMY